MNPKFYLIACLSFSIYQASIEQSIAMGNKDVPVESAKLQTKQQLIEELFTLFQFDKITLEAFLQPFEKELKELGLPEKPFAQSIKKFNAQTAELSAPLIDLLKDLYTRAHENTFTQQELVDLVALYKKPVIQKANMQVLNIFTEPVIKALKDPKLFAEYSSKIMAIGITMAATNSSDKEYASIVTKEFEAFIQNKHILTPEFLEKLKQRYTGLAPNLEKWFGKEITQKKIDELKESIEKMPLLKLVFNPSQKEAAQNAETSSAIATDQTLTLPN
ncbi:MAG: hypothetical protein Q8S31_07250 [Alphaproteobacteria bacterium]|nr:hypothetical protein [Alphaproteobacteria bacterium]